MALKRKRASALNNRANRIAQAQFYRRQRIVCDNSAELLETRPQRKRREDAEKRPQDWGLGVAPGAKIDEDFAECLAPRLVSGRVAPASKSTATGPAASRSRPPSAKATAFGTSSSPAGSC